MKIAIVLLAWLVTSPVWAASCLISEYRFMGEDGSNRVVPVAIEPAVTVQAVTYTSATSSSVFNSQTKFVRIICDAKAHFAFSVAGATDATASMPYLPANTPEYFGLGITGLAVSFYDGST